MSSHTLLNSSSQKKSRTIVGVTSSNTVRLWYSVGPILNHWHSDKHQATVKSNFISQTRLSPLLKDVLLLMNPMQDSLPCNHQRHYHSTSGDLFQKNSAMLRVLEIEWELIIVWECGNNGAHPWNSTNRAISLCIFNIPASWGLADHMSHNSQTCAKPYHC